MDCDSLTSDQAKVPLGNGRENTLLGVGEVQWKDCGGITVGKVRRLRERRCKGSSN